MSFTVRPNETMALVGESGCGKSLTSLAIMGLLPKTAVVTGEILFDGVNVLELNNRERNKLRGHDMAMIYQDALSSLNPAMLIRAQFKQLTKRGGTRTAEELLELVGLDPVRTLASYPHELSGGQRPRVLIAMSLTRSPRLIVADEPTTALDVTVQAQVVDLLNDLREKLGFAMVFVQPRPGSGCLPGPQDHGDVRRSGRPNRRPRVICSSIPATNTPRAFSVPFSRSRTKRRDCIRFRELFPRPETSRRVTVSPSVPLAGLPTPCESRRWSGSTGPSIGSPTSPRLPYVQNRNWRACDDYS